MRAEENGFLIRGDKLNFRSTTLPSGQSLVISVGVAARVGITKIVRL